MIAREPVGEPRLQKCGQQEMHRNLLGELRLSRPELALSV